MRNPTASSLTIASALTTLLLSTPVLAKKYVVNPDTGNSTMSAVFDAPFGERINAISSSISCELDGDADTGIVSGHCSLPLTSIVVDSEATKTDHFYQWTTNKKSDPLQCKFELTIDKAQAVGPLETKKPVSFVFDGRFTICGRSHEKNAKEHVTGQVMFFPAGAYGKAETLRIRAKIKGFNREAYHIGPKWTGGWLAKVQALADVVAAKGDIEINMFAKAVESPKTARK